MSKDQSMDHEAPKLPLFLKIISTFMVVMVVPIAAAYFFMNRLAEEAELDKRIYSLQNAQRYLTEALEQKQIELDVVAKRLATDRLLLEVVRTQLDSERFNARLQELARSFDLNSITVYDRSMQVVGAHSLSDLENNQPSIAKSGIRDENGNFDSLIEVGSSGMVLMRQIPLYADRSQTSTISHSVLIARLVPMTFLTQARDLLGVDFSFIDSETYSLSTLYDGYGRDLTGKPAIKAMKDGMSSVVEDGLVVQAVGYHDRQHLELQYDLRSEGFQTQATISLMMPMESLEASQIQQFLLFMTLFAIGIIFLSGFLLARNIVRPIRKLMDGVRFIRRRIYEGNNFYPVEVKSRDEIGILSRMFNDMGVDLTKAHGDLKRYNEELEDRVKDRTRELHHANESLTLKNDEMMRELLVARRVQEALLPESIIETKKTRIIAKIYPMTETSGDYFDVYSLGTNRYGILLLDVSGHGVPSALITTMAKVSFNDVTHKNLGPAELCRQVNEKLSPTLQSTGFYFTAFFAILDLNNGSLTFTNAGHQSGIRINRDSKTQTELDSEGFIVGVTPDAPFGETQILLEDSDRIVLFSDGIVEARNAEGEFYGRERLEKRAIEFSNLDSEACHDAIMEDVAKFCGDRDANDDRTLLVLDILESIRDSAYSSTEHAVYQQ